MADDAETPDTEGAGSIPRSDSVGPRADGLDLAKTIARGLVGKTGPERKRAPSLRRKAQRGGGEAYSGSAPDARDPQTLDTAFGGMVQDRGWQDELRVHGVFARWSAIVGDEVGRHSVAESLADGRLVIRAETTAWATQLTLMAPSLVRRLNEVLGEGMVEVVDVRGPRAPSWVKGKYRVKGRGPRDTYG